jgi:hypothetical protein
MLFIYARKNNEKGKEPLLVFIYVALQMLLFSKQFEMIFDHVTDKAKMGIFNNKYIGLSFLLFLNKEVN